MTPYAVLLAKPNDSDETIRRLYHAIARHCHPDACRGLLPYTTEKLNERWHTATEAYSAIKTPELRESWATRQKLLSGVCAACEGSGVAGTRMFKGTIRECKECKGEGRV